MVSDISPAGWSFILMNYNGTHHNLYTGSNLVDSTPTDGGPSNLPFDLTVGRYFNGAVDTVSLYDDAYTPDEMYTVNRA